MIQQTENPLLNWALEYYRNGIRVVCAYYKGKFPPKNGEWERYRTECVTEEQLAEWFGDGKWRNISAITGPASGGMTVLDFDSEGIYRAWADKYPESAASLPTSKSGRGYHVFFRSTLTKDMKLLPGKIDLKAGGLVSLPPSRHKSGVKYEWIRLLPANVQDLPLLDPLEWDLEHLHDGKDGKDGIEGNDGKEGVVKRGKKINLNSLSKETLETIEKAVEKTCPSRYGERNDLIFTYVRHLKGIDQLKAKTGQELIDLGIADMWYDRAEPYIQTKSRLLAVERFRNAWEDAKYPVGEGHSLEIAWENAEKSTLAMPELEQFEGEPLFRKTIRLCFELQRLAGPGESWFVPTNKGGRFLGISHQYMSTILNTLRRNEIGIIRKTKEYIKNQKCARYIYTGPSTKLLAEQRKKI